MEIIPILNCNDFENFMKSQIIEIEKHKWIESEKVGHDIGNNNAANDWIEKYSKSYRNNYLKRMN